MLIPMNVASSFSIGKAGCIFGQDPGCGEARPACSHLEVLHIPPPYSRIGLKGQLLSKGGGRGREKEHSGLRGQPGRSGNGGGGRRG